MKEWIIQIEEFIKLLDDYNSLLKVEKEVLKDILQKKIEVGIFRWRVIFKILHFRD